jgi:pimeloyl-ACP methyl ester carboxylesterase
MPPALPGDTQKIPTSAGVVHVYGEETKGGVPLLLVHSVNAAANAYEVRPLYLHYMSSRPVYAVDLPGFGFSERKDQTYTPQLMTDALCAVVAAIRARHDDQPVDVIALSLSCEYAALAAIERPGDYRSLGFISPTGFKRTSFGAGSAQATRGSDLKLAMVSLPVLNQALYDLLVSRPSMRFFLEKTWDSKKIDEGLFEYDQLSAHEPGARYVAASFLAGFLFAADTSHTYKSLTLPVWAVRGRRGGFVNYLREQDVAGQPNWSFDVFDTGAFPHFEQIGGVTRSYYAFQLRVDRDEAA